ncbi:MAG TPA: PQQ-dependent sugar dehydrogenase, partial [Terriglobia bacterium]|nr:PQQ-dependent sugar dehydrogenase [Terriglobia bacterium]
IRIVSNGVILPAAFLDIRSQVRCCGELGLLGLAFHPNFTQNGRFFVNYTRDGPGGIETVISEFSVSGSNPNLAVRESERILLTFGQPFTNHNGGMIAFGPHGYLYIASGDGGSGGDPQNNGQSLNTLLGKILRIDVNSGVPYGIPPDNPFASQPGRDEIFAYGLRNPWRFSFDRHTGRLFAGDVGQNRFEEIDLIEKGGNYGWKIMEGAHCFSPQSNCNTAGLILPIDEYGRDLGISVTGGYVYRGSAVPSLSGKYIFGDFGSGILWALTELSSGQWRREELLRTGLNISSFGEDDAGELYLVDYGGTVRRITSDGQEPAVNAAGLVNAASFLSGPVAPGQLVSIFGTGLGPNQGAGTQLDGSGRISRLLAGTRVWFDEIAAPLLFARWDQINAQVPYGIAGRSSVTVQVEYQGMFSNPVSMAVAPAAPGLFTQAGGAGPGTILNEDHSLNSAANPAARGSLVVLFATGEGQRNPAGEDGKLAEPPYPVPLLPVSVTIGGLPAAIEFVGAAPGFAGLLQINARVPAATAPGNAVPVAVQIGGASSQPGVTLAVQ